MNSVLDDLTNWFKPNRLALNVNKSNCMLFQPNGNQNTLGNTLNIGIDTIEHKLNCKFLGVLIDNQLHLCEIVQIGLYTNNSKTYFTIEIIKVTLSYNGPNI